jgi:hypothetical protein
LLPAKVSENVLTDPSAKRPVLKQRAREFPVSILKFYEPYPGNVPLITHIDRTLHTRALMKGQITITYRESNSDHHVRGQ